VTGTEGEALLREVRASLETLGALAAHRRHLGEGVVAKIESTLSDAEKRLARDRLMVVVGGEPNAGKTTFINALLGDRLLPPRRVESRILLLRHGPGENYRAELMDGTVEEFATLFPDRTGSIAERLRAAEAGLPVAKEERERAFRDLRTATEAADAARSALANTFKSFEEARGEAERLGRELARAEEDQARLGRRASTSAERLPAVVVTRPPWWAFWTWLVRFVLMLWHFRALAGHRSHIKELASARAQVARLRHAVSEAAGNCLRAEGRLASVASPADASNAAFSEARARLSELDKRIDELSREATKTRAELDEARRDRHRRFCEAIDALCTHELRGKEVRELEIRCPARFLPEDVTLIDAPRVAAGDPVAHALALEVVRDRADGCIFVADIEQGLGESAHDHVRLLRDIVPHMVLVLTKMDEYLGNGPREVGLEVAGAVEKARRVCTRRFAREVGRDPETVLSIAVAAEPTLETDAPASFVKRFAADTDTLFQLLRSERVLILAARAATEVRRYIRSVAEAEDHAERSYEEKITELERQRRPEPQQFRSEQLEASGALIAEAASAVTKAGIEDVASHVGKLVARSKELVEGCSNRAELKELFSELGPSMVRSVNRLQIDIARRSEERMDAALRDVEREAFAALRRRYDIAPPVTRWTQVSIHMEAAVSPIDETFDFAPLVEANIRKFTTTRAGFLVGGVAAGALAGTAVVPIMGTAIGAAAGLLLPFAKTFGSVKRHCLDDADTRLKAVQRALEERLKASEEALCRSMTAALDRSLSRAAVQYDQWITAPLEAERAVLEQERRKLRELVAIRERLQERDETLAHAMDAATEASLGLCKAPAP